MHRPSISWRALFSWLAGNRLYILMYHSIADNPRDPHAILPRVFEQHMHRLRSGQVISLEEGLKRLQSHLTLRNTCVITFDDALLDFYTTALPILKDFGYPATLFIPVGLVGQHAGWDSHDPSKLLMNWLQLERCQQWKVTFGSHSVRHIRLTECSEDRLEQELVESLQTLKSKLDNVFPALAYPGGYHNERVRKAAAAAGYICGLGAASRWGNGPETDVFQLRRMRMGR